MIGLRQPSKQQVRCPTCFNTRIFVESELSHKRSYECPKCRTTWKGYE